MYVVLFENGYALFGTSDIGKVSNITAILKSSQPVSFVKDGKLYDYDGNEITDYEDVTELYVDLSTHLDDILEVNKGYNLSLPTGAYAIYKNGMMVVKFNVEEGQTKTISFTEEGTYHLIALDRPCSGKIFYVVKPSVIIQ